MKLLLAVLLLTSAAFAAGTPNVLFILADDLGRADVGFMGATEVKTPNIDKLAGEGAVLERFYVQPVCSPTRACLMTGRYPSRLGLQVGVIRPHATYGLPLEERTLAQALRSVGYETAITGKWHLGEFEEAYRPTHRGFDHQYGLWFGMIDYTTHVRDSVVDWHNDDLQSEDEGYSTHLIAREAVKRIKLRDKAKPLFLYVPFNAVHSPYHIAPGHENDHAELKGQRRQYATMLDEMDKAVGQILNAWKDEGLRENSIIVFSSDNGGPAPGVVTSNGPLRAGKGTLYEGGVRVCAAAVWDGHIKAGARITEPMHMVDWYPTLLKLCGASLEQPKPLDGLDIMPVLTASAKSPHDAILLNTTPSQGAIRMGDWKLVLNGAKNDAEGGLAAKPAARAKNKGRNVQSKADSIELFDLASDDSEKKNLATEHPEKVKELRARLDQYQSEAVWPRNLKKPE